MELFTARLRLTALREEDADALFGYRSNPAVARYQGWCPVTRAEALAFIRAQREASSAQRGRWMQRAIRLSDNDDLIGDMGVHIPVDLDASYEFGISIAPAYQGQGYAREALEAVFAFVFQTWRAHRMHASIDPRNIASAALLRSLGMRQEAHFLESLKLRGEWVDDAIYALLAREWLSARSDRSS
ncbi:GNAT family protein [Dyella sp. 2HG41-7]|uniref:GNAT family N-acetyltransferase n=1 Tax=Dyella sp. 2HG41-7 TaxID=2883239 RepID=UPI001F2884C0|nr:GNAT family protein [Dyella sp. 2HG41-7]